MVSLQEALLGFQNELKDAKINFIFGCQIDIFNIIFTGVVNTIVNFLLGLHQLFRKLSKDIYNLVRADTLGNQCHLVCNLINFNLVFSHKSLDLVTFC